MVTQEDTLARHFRVKMSSPFIKTDNFPQPINTLFPKLVLPNQTVIKMGEPKRRLPPVRYCIYCGATEFKPKSRAPLSDEHIVAIGLGGTLILEEASCCGCSKHTNERIEQLILNGSLLAPRRQLQIRGRKRKRKEQEYELITLVGEREVRIRLSLEEHPSILLITGFNRPRIVGGAGGICGAFIRTFNVPDEALSRRAESIASHAFDTVLFCQMLAKIAHGYAVGAIGAEKFDPYLPAFILRKFEGAEQYPACYDLVGGNPIDIAPSEPDELHQLGHEIFAHDGKQLLLVGIRLFANLGAPLFWVVAGEILS